MLGHPGNMVGQLELEVKLFFGLFGLNPAGARVNWKYSVSAEGDRSAELQDVLAGQADNEERHQGQTEDGFEVGPEAAAGLGHEVAVS